MHSPKRVMIKRPSIGLPKRVHVKGLGQPKRVFLLKKIVKEKQHIYHKRTCVACV